MGNNDNSNHLPLNLQFFADPAPGGEEDPNGGGAADPKADPKGDPKADPKPAEPSKSPTFAEMLKDKDFASALDKHVSKAINTAQKNWEEEQKLSEADLAKKKQTEAEEVLSKREAELAARELRADMVTEIGKRGLPAALIDAVSLADKDAATLSLDNVEKAFRAAVTEAVDEKLKGKAPAAGGGADIGGSLEEEILAKMNLPKT